MPNTAPPPELETKTATATPQSIPASTAELTETLIAEPSDDTSIRPFQFRAADEDLAELKRRIAATEGPLGRVVEAALSEVEQPVAAQQDSGQLTGPPATGRIARSILPFSSCGV